MENKYLVLSSSSDGFCLYSLSNGEMRLGKSRGKVSFKSGSVLIGDEVYLDRDGFICAIETRKNTLSRPRLANCDLAFVIISGTENEFSTYLLDKFLSLINHSGIRAEIIVTKADLLSFKELSDIRDEMSYYERIGYEVFYINAHDDSTYDFAKVRDELHNKRVAFIGQTGVGKSSFINSLDSSFKRRVDSLFIKSGRGRHTTKETILLPYMDSFIFDTPGFSDLKLTDFSPDDLAVYFPGFINYYGKCKFKDCSHINIKGCEVLKALDENTISKDSYDNYVKIYKEIKEERPTNRKAYKSF